MSRYARDLQRGRVLAFQFLRSLVRDGRLLIALSLLVVLAAVAGLLDSERHEAWTRSHEAADRLDRATFVGQGPRNPHSVAHFARYAFKPLLTTSVLDPGVIDYAGSAVWMEAHSQDPANVRRAEDRLDLGRFTELSLAWLLQVIAPLLVIALGFDAVAGDRARGTLALLLSGGARPSLLVWARTAALGIPFLAALAVLGVSMGVYTLAGPSFGDEGLRMGLWLLWHVIYLSAWVMLTLAASIRLAGPRTALTVLLTAWSLTVLVAPRLSALGASQLAEAPSWLELSRSIQDDLKEGSKERAAAFKEEVLAKYKVERVEDLPVSFAGLSLQQSEEHGNRVFDRHFKRLGQTYLSEITWRRVLGGWSPLPALQHLSMSAAGTDIVHHLDFAAQAETTRRNLVRFLNEDMIENATGQNGKGKDFEYLADKQVWEQTPEFRYALPSLSRQWGHIWPDALTLLAWFSLAVFLTLRSIRWMETPR